jgi:hypothetical protein
MTATLPSLDPYSRSKKSDLVFTRGVTGLRHGPAIDQLEGTALRSILVVENGERTMFCNVTRSRKSVVKDLETCFGLPSQ